MRRILACCLALAFLSCGGGGGGGGGNEQNSKVAPLVVAAGLAAVDPAADHSFVAGVDLGRLGLDDGGAAYDLTTPAGEPFRFDLITRNPGNSGPVHVSVAHAESDGAVPIGGAESLVNAGISLDAAGVVNGETWVAAYGDGFARITVSGEIEAEQVLAVAASNGEGEATAVVRLRIGPPSAINLSAQAAADWPGLAPITLYSSDSFMFGLPTVAVSGDRTSIVCYEGDRANTENYARYELRLQHDALSGIVTGGGSEEASPDSGNWRDHEIAALFNVLALAHSGTDRVTVKLSFDRGATFDQTEEFAAGADGYAPRLVQAEMASDYTLAVLFWVAEAESTNLHLVLGRPSRFDGGGSPTRFDFDAPVVLHAETGDVTPLPMGVAWSTGGDLAVGYGFSRFTLNPDLTFESVTQSRCAVRLHGGGFTDTLVDEDVVVGKDPSVAVTGAGSDLAVFYAFEGPQGVRLAVSGDGGATFAPLVSLADGSSHTPSVLAREAGGRTILDLLYVVDAAEGRELHLLHWADYAAAAPETFRLTTASSVGGSEPPGPPPGGIAFAPPTGGRKVTQLAWLGYDAVVDSGHLVVVVDEETVEGWCWLYEAPFRGEAGGMLDAGMAPPAPFVPAEPPPLAPGMTEPVPPPDPEDMHQLKLLVIS